jgi:hypothetical protein
MNISPPLAPPRASRRKLLRLLAATPLLGACSGPSVLSQADIQPMPAEGRPRELTAPDLRVGDEWRYILRSVLTGLTTDRVQLRVTAVDADGYTLAGQSQSGGPFEVRYDRNLNQVRDRSLAYTPAYPRFAFPLAIGKAWETEVRTNPIGIVGQGTLLQRVSGIARGWERVTVPAGIFTALRIDLAIDWRDTAQATIWGNSAETFWYATEVRNAVFHHRIDFPQGRLQSNNSVTELESFRVEA